jgi:hypothetical protein
VPVDTAPWPTAVAEIELAVALAPTAVAASPLALDSMPSAVVPVPGCATELAPQARSWLPAFCTQFAGALGGVTVCAEAGDRSARDSAKHDVRSKCMMSSLP